MKLSDLIELATLVNITLGEYDNNRMFPFAPLFTASYDSLVWEKFANREICYVGTRDDGTLVIGITKED